MPPISARSPAPGDAPTAHPARSLRSIFDFWPWVAAAASGVLLTLCYPRFESGWLVWTALTPLICAAWFRRAPAAKSWWRAALSRLAPGYLTGVIFFTATFHWLGSLAELYRDRLLLSLPLLLGLLFAGYVAVWTWFLDVLVPRGEARRFPNSWRNLATGATGACAWVVLEWVRSWLFGGFGWNGLGVALHRDLAMIQIADITGVWGLSWLVAYVNLMSVIIVRRIVGELGPTFLRRIRWEFSLSVGLMVAVFGYGIRTLLRNDSQPSVELRVAAIQPNIPQTEKFDPNAEEKTLETLDRLTHLASLGRPGPQLILWPEACLPKPLFGDEKIYRFVLGLLERADFSLLLGTVDFDPEKSEDYNTATLLTDHGVGQQIYRKIHLVPFGEYLPLRPIFAPFVGELVPGDFTRGGEYKMLRLPDPPLELAGLVCFEDTVGDLTRRFVARGAHLLVNVTNDGWFADSPAAEQHLANAVFRAIENRRPLLRCGNTGLTGSVDPQGRLARFDRPTGSPTPRDVIPFLKPFEQGFVAGRIPVPTARRFTIYTRYGDWLPRLGIFVTLLALVPPLLRARRSR